MGEVYRGRDLRLHRQVAIKVLPEDIFAEPRRIKRFENEARSASALNHPNIVTIYDTGATDGIAWIAMEFVEGETLGSLLGKGALPIKRILSIAVQIADGLAKAHEAGIVHRDLKPENVMITEDGLVKILDFGLAKLKAPSTDADADLKLPTLTATTPGAMMGTVAYMSPEQAAGNSVDFPSDQFTLGSILYEMVTGKKSFLRKTSVDTLAAILNEDPEPIGAINPGAPGPLRWIVERCLQKESQFRYVSTRDLARELAALRDHISDVPLITPENVRQGGWFRRVAAAVGIGAAIVLAVWLFGASWRRSERVALVPSPTQKQLTFRRGNLIEARFAPDGRTVVYSAAWDGQPPEIFTIRGDSKRSRPLELKRAVVLSVSSKGELAVLLTKNDLASGVGTLARVSADGGTPREILDDVWCADWSPDGGDLAALVERPGEKRQLQFPIGKIVAEGNLDRVAGVRVSPDGMWVAFVDGDTITAVNRDGGRRVVSGGWWLVNELMWSRQGDKLLFAGEKRHTEPSEEQALSIYSMTLSGVEHRIASTVLGTTCLFDSAPDGQLLVEKSYTRRGVRWKPTGEAVEQDLSTIAVLKSISDDGRSILSLTDILRANAPESVYLGDPEFQDLSADGRWALGIRTGTPRRLVIVATGAGGEKQISVDGLEPESAWVLPKERGFVLRAKTDGRSILATVGPHGGAPRLLRSDDYRGGYVAISPDGTRVAFATTANQIMVVPTAGSEGSLIPNVSLLPGEGLVQWSADGRSLYLARTGNASVPVQLVDIATGRREAWKTLGPPDTEGLRGVWPIRVSRDGQSYAYGYRRSVVSDLYILGGIR